MKSNAEAGPEAATETTAGSGANGWKAPGCEARGWPNGGAGEIVST